MSFIVLILYAFSRSGKRNQFSHKVAVSIFWMENRFDNIILRIRDFQILRNDCVINFVAFPGSGTTEEDFLNGEFHDCKANYQEVLCG